MIIPNKSDLGKASKQILQKVNKEVRELTKLQQWQNKPCQSINPNKSGLGKASMQILQKVNKEDGELTNLQQW